MNKIVTILVLSFAAFCIVYAADLNMDVFSKGVCFKWVSLVRKQCNSTTNVADKVKIMKKVIECAKFPDSCPKWTAKVLKDCSSQEKIACQETAVVACGLGKITNKQQDEAMAWFKAHDKDFQAACKEALECIKKAFA